MAAGHLQCCLGEREHTHAPRSILELARKLGPDVTSMRAINPELTDAHWQLRVGVKSQVTRPAMVAIICIHCKYKFATVSRHAP